MNNQYGIFTLSLDFELFWGMRDIVTIDAYGEQLLGARKAIPGMLDLFAAHEAHATWATVGLLFFDDTQQLKQNLPVAMPNYQNKDLSPYPYIEGNETLASEYHFAPALIGQISDTKGQEIGTHTFSHYYCGEEGQSIDEFKADIEAAIQVARQKGIDTKSLIFPRNQWDPDYLPALDQLGIQSFRGNQDNWMYQVSDYKSQLKPVNRAARLADAYVNLSGHNTFKLSDCGASKPYNFPASRQLRPYSQKLSVFENLRLKRIKKSMDYAAKHNEIFHLWWHPHNFGANIERNLEFLEKILLHYSQLHESFGMQSLNMGEMSAQLQ